MIPLLTCVGCKHYLSCCCLKYGHDTTESTGACRQIEPRTLKRGHYGIEFTGGAK